MPRTRKVKKEDVELNSIPEEIVPEEEALELEILEEEDYVEEDLPTSMPRSSSSHDATQLYLSEIGYAPLLSAEEEVEIAQRARKGDETARKRMIESNLRLVEKQRVIT